MKKIAVIVATGFEDTELVGTVDVFTREGISYDLISIENKDQVVGQANIAWVKTKKLQDVDLNEYDGLFLPGGQGHKILLKSSLLKESIIKFNNEKKFLFAICAAPEVFKQAGILEGVTITSYPGFALMDTNTGNPFEISGHIVTGKNMESTVEFAQTASKVFKEK